MTAQYKRVLEVYKRNPFTRDPLNLFLQHTIEKEIGPRFMSDVEKLYFQTFPRRRKFILANVPEEVINEMRAKWQPKAIKIIEVWKRQHDKLLDLLYEMAPSADMTPLEEMNVVKSVSADNYRSQGYGCNTYAHGELLPLRDLLINNGFMASIEEEPGNAYHGIRYNTYHLVADATDWQLDALTRANPLKSKDYWQYNINPKVIHPFMED